MSRRDFLAKASFAAGSLLSARGLFGLQASSAVTVSTPSGTLKGEAVGGVRLFRGVPFARPPVGDLRFRPPQKAQRWTGSRDATQFAAAAMQWGDAGVRHSEDCLYLNVWAPEGKGPYPVYVWIHGGGFLSGRSFDPVVDGAAFAREGIVCITVAYRLGVFGFLDMEPLLGAGYAGSANNALRDIILSLEWVRDNVAAFGGDPSRVTIGGESAGAKLTDILMGIPSAEPLFHQMISESGGAERLWSRPDSAVVAKGYGDEWRHNTGQAPDALRTAAPGSLIEVQHRFIAEWPQHFPLRAEVDGHLIPQLPVKTIADGSTKGKRLLIGTNRDESALFIGPHPAGDATAAELGNMSLARFNSVFSRYQAVYPQMDHQHLLIRAITAEEYWVPSVRVAEAHVRGGGSAWMYRLDFAESSGRLKDYAYHSLDVGIVWARPHTGVANAGAEGALSRQMHQAWAAFIRGESPSAPGLPAWPQYTLAERSTMILNTVSQVQQQPQQAELRLWDEVL
ncbi:MAG: carboxylesterase/lipase family protein [Acidobacteria bacterium]|nr:carboxylesterase/lipase family protein [Acidobacteriota bacterium]MBW4045025.1 carboxylesterase/lipase family protein [Acidobacteriota bacterium]